MKKKVARWKKRNVPTPELESGKNYIYAKFLQGFNYIVTPRRSGKTTAAKMIERTGSYNLISCPGNSIGQIQKKLRGNLVNFIFDEFEFYNVEIQLSILDIYASKPSTVKYLFLTSPRNIDLSIQPNDHIQGHSVQNNMSKNYHDMFNSLIEMQKIRKHVITEEKLLVMNRLMSL